MQNRTTHLTQKDLARRWNLSIRTLEGWRNKGCGPEFFKLEKSVRYHLEHVQAYEQNRLCQNSAQSCMLESGANKKRHS